MSVSHHDQGGRRLARRQQRFNPRAFAAVYEDPATGWREGVPQLAWLWLLLFGGFYLAARSVWRPAIIMFVIGFGCALLFLPLAFLVMPILWIVAAAQAQSLFRNHYMRLGWDEIDPWQQDEEGATGLM